SRERNVPVLLSSPGAPALAPVISGERVVWQSERSQGEEDLGVELFARGWSSGEERRVVSGPGDQHSARLSRGRLAWLETDADANRVRSCRWATARAPCREQSASARTEPGGGLGAWGVRPGSERPGPGAGVDVSGEHLVWTEPTVPDARWRGCRWRGEACEEL